MIDFAGRSVPGATLVGHSLTVSVAKLGDVEACGLLFGITAAVPLGHVPDFFDDGHLVLFTASDGDTFLAILLSVCGFLL